MPCRQTITIFRQGCIGLLPDQLPHLDLMPLRQKRLSTAPARLGRNRAGLKLPPQELRDKRKTDPEGFRHLLLGHFMALTGPNYPLPQVF
jgi:hypothetical protein